MVDFRNVTETVGTECSQEQLARAVSRYGWVREFCAGKDVLEVACGTGQGLKMLQTVAKSLQACDISEEMVTEVKANHPSLTGVHVSNETNLPMQNQSLDIVICFEAIYYFNNLIKFFEETKRVLRNGGLLFLSFPNCELFDFNPSPFSVSYFKPQDLRRKLGEVGFKSQFYGGFGLSKIGMRQKFFRPLKGLASRLGFIPGSMRGKAFLKRIVFGSLQRMPKHLDFDEVLFEIPQQIEIEGTPPAFKVIYCKATI